MPPSVHQPDWLMYAVLSYTETPVLVFASNETSGTPRMPPVRAEIPPEDSS